MFVLYDHLDENSIQKIELLVTHFSTTCLCSSRFSTVNHIAGYDEQTDNRTCWNSAYYVTCTEYYQSVNVTLESSLTNLEQNLRH